MAHAKLYQLCQASGLDCETTVWDLYKPAILALWWLVISAWTQSQTHMGAGYSCCWCPKLCIASQGSLGFDYVSADSLGHTAVISASLAIISALVLQATADWLAVDIEEGLMSASLFERYQEAFDLKPHWHPQVSTCTTPHLQALHCTAPSY